MKEFLKRVLTEIEEEPESSKKPIPNDFKEGSIHWKKFWIVLGGLLGLAAVLFYNLGYMLPAEIDKGDLVYYSVMFPIISFWLASENLKWSQSLKLVTLWGGIALMLMVGYSYRFELGAVKDRVLGNLNPSHGFEQSEYSISFPAATDGHFYIRATINDMPVRFLVDTGASHIVLAPHVAEDLGFDLKTLPFDRKFNTANGIVRGSSVFVPNLQIGNLYLNDVSATVNQAPLDSSLLGMSFFKRLKSYKVENNTLTLTW